MTEQQKLTETKPINRLLVANRGEVAIRIMRAAWECAIDTVAVYSDDDAQSLHLRHAGHAVALGANLQAGKRICAIPMLTGLWAATGPTPRPCSISCVAPCRWKRPGR